MKYHFTNEQKIVDGVIFRRIQRDDTGELGGWLEKESNLAQDGKAWVFGEARVSGKAWVFGEAQVFGEAWVTKFSECIYVSNLQYSVTVTPQSIQIGCQTKPYKEWMKLTKTEAMGLGLRAENYRLFKQLLPILHKQVCRK